MCIQGEEVDKNKTIAVSVLRLPISISCITDMSL